MLLTGSKALSLYVPNKIKFNDIDLIASEEELNKVGLSFNGADTIKHKEFEFLRSDILGNDSLETSSIVGFFTLNYKRVEVRACSLESLYIQKRSHIWRAKKFDRHIMFLKMIKEEMAFRGIPIDEETNREVKKRAKLTKERYGDRVPSLKKTNEEFFDDYVKKFYVHDDIHEVMAHYDRPIYTRLKHDDSLAFCEKDLWNQLSHEDKVKCVREECFVIGVERFLVPRLEMREQKIPERFAFDKALEKVCTTLCSGYFRDFAIDNFFEIREYKIPFYNLFLEAVETGRLKRC